MPGDREGPPGREEPGATPSTGPNHKSGITKPTNQAQPIAAHRPCRRTPAVGRFVHAWREGFGYGFRDALRLAQRQIDDPAVWVVLDRLADKYELAAAAALSDKSGPGPFGPWATPNATTTEASERHQLKPAGCRRRKTPARHHQKIRSRVAHVSS